MISCQCYQLDQQMSENPFPALNNAVFAKCVPKTPFLMSDLLVFPFLNKHMPTFY